MKTVKIKALHYKATFEGVGCVNYDAASQQKYELNSKKLLVGDYRDNASYAKKSYFVENGQDVFLYKVSSEALRHAAFVEEMPYINPTVLQIPHVLYNALAHPALLCRGYMFTTKDSLGLKRKSPLCLPDAIEDGPKRTKVCLDIHTRAGEKNTAVKDEDMAKDTTLYSIENVGNNFYKTSGAIDVQELQFISADPTYDRMGLDADGGEYEGMFMDALRRNFPDFKGGFDYYYMQNQVSQDEWAERGILLDNKSVDYLVKYILKHIMNIQIYRRNAWLKFRSLEVSFDNEKTFVEITTDNIDDFFFDVDSKYRVADEQRIIKNKELSEAVKEIKKEKSTKNNKGKKSNKKPEEISESLFE